MVQTVKPCKSSLRRRRSLPSDVHFSGQHECRCPLELLKGTVQLPPPGVPVGSPSRGGGVTVYVRHKPTELAHSFLFCSCVHFCLYGPFNCISFHKFSRQLSALLLGFSRFYALLVLSTIYLFMKVSFSPDKTPSV